jgi:hypothetical protein
MSESIVANGKVPRQSSTTRSTHPAGRLAAIYARVSSEEQRENQIIKTQIEAAKRWAEFQKLVEHPIDITELYLDDGVSGTIALAERPVGKRLLDDAAHGKFELVLVYKIDRLGRDPRDILNATHRLDQLGVAVKSLTEEFDLSTPSGKFMFNVFAAAAGFARDSQLERMNEAKITGPEKVPGLAAWYHMATIVSDKRNKRAWWSLTPRYQACSSQRSMWSG